VSWYGAKAFAIYNGWDLPREAEWEMRAGEANSIRMERMMELSAAKKLITTGISVILFA